MRIDIVTVFPEMVAAALDHSIVKRAMERGLVTIRVVNLRDFTRDRHKSTDDTPYGGGGGMVMLIEPLARAVAALTDAQGSVPADSEAAALTERAAAQENETAVSGVPSTGQDAAGVFQGIISPPRVVLTDPRGARFTQEIARQWAQERHIILLCGHYEGVDERVRQHLVTDAISIGDYILTGGELPALVITDALTRLQPGALGDSQAPEKDTFTEHLLEYPHYTRPRVFDAWAVPDILLSGHHALIERWRRWHQLRATRERRPDLFARLELAPQDLKLLDSEEPTAPPDAKTLLRSTRAARRPPEMRAAPTNEKTEREEYSDGTGTGNHT